MKFAQPFHDYEILARVGAGAMGTVFRARQQRMNRVVALKVLRPSLARNRKYVERLRREARIVGALNHPNIVTGYDLGEEGGYHYFVMEFVEGQSLRSLLQEWGLFPEERVLAVGIQVAEALEHAFERGVIHRDIKPGNIIIDDAGNVKLTDMGLAKGPTDLTLTRDGATVGTPQFISPEQAIDPQNADIRSDLYSLGATLFQMATGSAPFAGETIGKLIDQVLNEAAPLVSDLNPSVSHGLSLVIKKLLAKDPALRYQTPAELLDDLRRVKRDEAPGVDLKRLERSDRGYGKGRGERRSRRWIVVAAVAGVLLTGSVWWVVDRVNRPTAASESDGERLAREMRAQLSAAGSLRDRVETVERYRARIASTDERRVFDALSSEPIRALESALERLADAGIRSVDLDTWINDPVHWSDVRGYIAHVELGMPELTGFRREELPAAFARVWNEQRNAIEVEVKERMVARDEQYRSAFVRYLQDDVERRLAAALSQGEFERARDLLREGESGFHGRNGRPELAQLGAESRSEFEERMRQFVARWTRSIRDEEATVATVMREDVSRELQAIRAAMAGDGVAAVLIGRLDEFRDRHLPGQFPSVASFSRTSNPWPEIQRDIAHLRRELESEQQAIDRAALSNYLQFAYRVLVSGSIEEAIAIVERRAETSVDGERIRRHLDLLRSAARVRDRVFERLIAGASRREIPVRGGKVLLARGDSGQIRLLDRRGERPLAFAVVAASLLDFTKEALRVEVESDPSLGPGLAMWYVLIGDIGLGNELVKADVAWQEFIATDVGRLVAECDIPELRDAAPATTGVLAELVRARERDDLKIAEYWLGVIDAKHALDESERGVRDDVEQWVRLERRRVERLEQLRARALSGAAVEVDLDGTEFVEYELRDDLEVALHAAWRRGARSVAVDGVNYTLDEVRERRASFDTVVNTDRGVRALFELTFAESFTLPRLIVVRLSGVACVLAVLPNGMAVAQRLDYDALRDAGDLRRALEPILTAAASRDSGPFVVPGAHHRLAVELAGTGRTKLRVALDGALLCDSKVHVGAQRSETIELLPFQEIELRRLRVTAPKR